MGNQQKNVAWSHTKEVIKIQIDIAVHFITIKPSRAQRYAWFSNSEKLSTCFKIPYYKFGKKIILQMVYLLLKTKLNFKEQSMTAKEIERVNIAIL